MSDKYNTWINYGKIEKANENLGCGETSSVNENDPQFRRSICEVLTDVSPGQKRNAIALGGITLVSIVGLLVKKLVDKDKPLTPPTDVEAEKRRVAAEMEARQAHMMKHR